MKNLLRTLAFLGLATAANAQGNFEAITNYSLGSFAGSVGTGGWTFQLLTDVTITDLGCTTNAMGDNGNGPMQIGIWTAGGIQVTAVTVTASSTLVNQTLYQSITPVLLIAGTYHIGAYSPFGSTLLNFITQGVDGEAFLSADVRLVASATGDGGFVFPGTLGPNDTMLLGPNFLYRSGVPEPSAFALLLLGNLVFAIRKLRRR